MNKEFVENEIHWRLILFSQDLIQEAYSRGINTEETLRDYAERISNFIGSAKDSGEKEFAEQLRQAKKELENSGEPTAKLRRYVEIVAGLTTGFREKETKKHGEKWGRYINPVEYLYRVSTETPRIIYAEKDGKRMPISVPSSLNIVQ